MVFVILILLPGLINVDVICVLLAIYSYAFWNQNQQMKKKNESIIHLTVTYYRRLKTL